MSVRTNDAGAPLRGKAARYRRYDPALAVGLILAGCLLSFYLVGLPLIAVGAWMWTRRRGREAV
jgi:hypothetical protein